MQKPGARQPKGRKLDLHISVDEDTHTFFAKQAEHYARPQNRHVVLILEAFAAVQRKLDSRGRDQLDHLIRHPEELGEHLMLLLAKVS